MIDAVAALRPFLWLAAIAFLVGFVSYLAMGRPAPAMAEAQDRSWASQASGPVSAPVSDEWNTPKRI